MLYRVIAFGCEFIVSESLARMIDGYCGLCSGEEITLERALNGWAFEAKYLDPWDQVLTEWEAEREAD